MSNQSEVASGKLLIVQPYVPSYRVSLFRAMESQLASEGIQMKLAVAGALEGDKRRSDDRSEDIADYLLPSKVCHIGSRVLFDRDLRIPLSEFRPNMVIVEQAIKNAESWPLILRSGKWGNPSIAMWGQGRSYSTSQSNFESNTKQWLTRKCDWFFAYTGAGARFVIDKGFPSNKITTLNNSTDTHGLQTDLKSITPTELETFKEMHGLQFGGTAIYIGGLDSRKGIRFLLEAANRIEQQLSGFKLLIGGDGELADLVQDQSNEGGPIVYLGRVEGRAKALALSASKIILIPEWVGLVAVDSLAAKIPIVTTLHKSHSPEFEYLRNGENSIVVQHDVEVYSRTVSALLADPATIERLSRNCEIDQLGLSTESMASRFSQGVSRWQHTQSGI